jgi:uncharacterized membrane protein YkgB
MNRNQGVTEAEKQGQPDFFVRHFPWLDQVDLALVRWMRKYGIHLLRIALSIVFIWFGLLKVIDRSPVEGLIDQTVPLVSMDWFLPFLGAWEIAVGLGLLFQFAMRLTLLLFWLQMAGTFLTMVVQPDIAFQDNNPILLTTEGEFVVKNLVLIAAGIVIGSTVRRRRPVDAAV